MELALEILPQVLLDGVVLGFMYALIALGYTMVYGVLEFINFAHSEIFVLGAFVGVEVLLLLQSAGQLATLHPAVILLLVIITGMVVSGVAAMALERVAYRPLLGGPRLVALISAIGASFFLQDGLRLFESLWRNTFYLNYPSLEFFDRNLPVTANLVIPVKSLLVIVTALLTLAGLYFFVNHTKLGTAIRAVAQDPDTASLMGVPVNQVIALTFFVGGALGGLAGVLFGIHYSLVNPYSGFVPGMKAFTAAVLGGIGNIPGAVLGGMMLGLLEAFAASYLSIMTDGAFGAEYKDVVAFLVLILILIFRPKGLLGETVREGKA
ncbi:MAG TPA: branched-chain amino acid ABC transporter permease [Candidatus Binatia bacterium]|nr:branched-chain amino acid ABC transporter permease [Candidatus Binatia bacterium]